MQFTKTLAVLAAALVGSAAAQRPANMSICDYYTTALLMNNTAANQYTLLTLIVNTAVIGNYTQPNVGIAVPGILAANATYNGTTVNLAPYFTGALASTNTGGMMGVSVNFLDGGGAAPLMMNMPANNTSSNQYMLLTHLYQYFGALLGCSATGFPAYQGDASQYSVHKFMDLSYAEVGYFIQQVAYSAASFGVAQSDLMVVGNALGTLFDYRCSPPTTVIPAQGPQLQAICIDSTCPLAMNASCASYMNVTKPTAVAAGGASSTSVSMMTGTMTATAAPAKSAAANAAAGVSFAAVAGGLFALFL